MVMSSGQLPFNGGDVLVATARQVHQDDLRRPQVPRQTFRMRDCVRRLERGQDPFEARERLEGRERVVIGDVRVFGTAERSKPGMLGADCRVVEAGGNRMREIDVAVLVLEHERPGALQDAGAAAREPRGVTAASDGLAEFINVSIEFSQAAQRGAKALRVFFPAAAVAAATAEAPAAPQPVTLHSAADKVEREQVERLFHRLVEAKKKAGEKVSGNLDSFSSFVQKKSDEIRKQYGCQDVEFSVELTGGQVKLKAKAKA